MCELNLISSIDVYLSGISVLYLRYIKIVCADDIVKLSVATLANKSLLLVSPYLLRRHFYFCLEVFV